MAVTTEEPIAFTNDVTADESGWYKVLRTPRRDLDVAQLATLLFAHLAGEGCDNIVNRLVMAMRRLSTVDRALVFYGESTPRPAVHSHR